MLPCFKTCRTPLFEQQTLANLRPKRGRVCVCEGEGGGGCYSRFSSSRGLRSFFYSYPLIFIGKQDDMSLETNRQMHVY